MRLEILIVILFSVATAVALLTRRFRIPYTVALVLAGLGLGTVHVFEAPHLTKQLLYTVFLPGLVFEAAFHLDFKTFWANRRAMAALAVPGVIASIVLTAVLMLPASHVFGFADRLGWNEGLLLGALLAATDPIAVVALFKTMGAPRRLSILIEAESLLNDGTAVVLFTIVLGAVGGNVSIQAGIVEFIRVVGLGAVVGGGIGYGVSRIVQRTDDPMIEITLTTIAAYASFALAETFHQSGIIATLTAGMICGNFGTARMSPSGRIATQTFWEYIAFALNSVIFLLIGFEVRVVELVSMLGVVVIAWLAITLGRALVVGGVSVLLRKSTERIPWRWSAAMTWGGLRGALAMVLALGLPEEIRSRDLVIRVTFGVVVLSILLQGLTMGTLLRWLRLTGEARPNAYDASRGEALAARAALDAIEDLRRDGAVHPDVLGELRARYEVHMQGAEQSIRGFYEQMGQLRDEETRRARRHLLMVEKDELLRAHRQGLVGTAALDELLARVDRELLELDAG